MMKKHRIIIGFILALGLVGGALLLMGKNPPSIAALRSDPTLFRISDYKDQFALHARLSTLFPRGSDKSNIDSFMDGAGIKDQQNDGQTCTYSADYENIRFIYGLNDDRVISLHIKNGDAVWPPFKESCAVATQELTPTTPQNETPIHLPLQPLNIEE